MSFQLIYYQNVHGIQDDRIDSTDNDRYADSKKQKNQGRGETQWAFIVD